MIRWVSSIFLGLILFSSVLPGLVNLGVGSRPGDVRFKLFGQILSLPFGSTVLWSAIAFINAVIVKRTCLFCRGAPQASRPSGIEPAPYRKRRFHYTGRLLLLFLARLSPVSCRLPTNNCAIATAAAINGWCC